MDMTMQLSRTAKGQEEIFNLGHTLRPRHRQILFSVGDGISFSELRGKLPNCADLETMVNELLQSGFIQSLRNMATGNVAAAAAPVQSAAGLEAGRSYVLEFMATLVGTKSPAYRQMSEVQDLAGFNAVLPVCRRVIAAVASPHQAAEMEAEAAKRIAG
ncbi:MAG TPA: hypothetical protein VFO43_02940 [Thiobacillus sp.]|nr:hypothetical protein [Thiobacillus sp.]